MLEIDHTEMEWVIKKVYETKTALFIWGATGIGKSQIVKKVAKDLAEKQNLEFREGNYGEGIFTLIDIRLSEEKDPSNLKGLPYPNESRTKTKWLPIEALPDQGQGIIFFDELNLALPIIQSACYEIILDRKLGGKPLPNGFLAIAAGNRIEDCANIYEMARPLANRFCHITLNIPPANKWCDWGLENDIDTRIVSFLQFKPSYLYKFDEDANEQAFPTPRAWEICSKLIKGENDNKKLKLLVSMAVGSGVGYEFTAFNSLTKNLNINEILDDPSKIEEIKDISVKYSLIGAIGELYKSKMKKDKDKKLLGKILNLCNYFEPEFSILLLRFIKKTSEISFKRKVVDMPIWRDVSKKYSKYLFPV